MSVKVAVIGVGHLGRHHARIYHQMHDVELVAVVDADPERAQKWAEQYSTEAVSDFREIAGKVDLVSVAVPTVAHYEVASFFLEQRIPVLVEKPITATVEQARKLTQLARDKNVCLQVGHVERFQPAFKAAKQLKFEPRFIEAHRLAPFSFRSTDIGVVHDLMIHDLELVLNLVQSPIQQVRANGGSVLSPSEDIASARLEFENGAVANLTASRISLTTMRKMRVFSPDVFLSLDFDKKYAVSARKKGDFEARLHGQWAALSATPPDQLKSVAAGAFRDLIDLKELDLDDQEPLFAELTSFVESVREGAEPEVAGEEALHALEAAELVLKEIQSCPW